MYIGCGEVVRDDIKITRLYEIPDSRSSKLAMSNTKVWKWGYHIGEEEILAHEVGKAL